MFANNVHNKIIKTEKYRVLIVLQRRVSQFSRVSDSSTFLVRNGG